MLYRITNFATNLFASSEESVAFFAIINAPSVANAAIPLAQKFGLISLALSQVATINKESDITLSDGSPGHSYSVTISIEQLRKLKAPIDKALDAVLITTQQQDKTYIVVYATEIGRMSQYQSVFDNILNSVTIGTASLSGSNLASPTSSGASLKVALLTDALFSDPGWGGMAYDAAQVLKNKYGLGLTTQENIAIPDIEPTLRDAADAGNNIILAYGFEWGDPAVKVAMDYPNTKFVVFSGLASSANVVSIFPMQQEGSFLLGALAGLMTKTNSLGCVGGKAYPNIINIFEGFKQGAKMVNPNVKITCEFIDDFQSPAKGKEAGLSLVNNGADFLIHVADLSGWGVIEAAKEKGIYAFGVVADQNKLAPDTVLSSFVLDVEKAFDEAIKMIQNGNFSGQVYKPGLETVKGGPGSGIVYLASFHSLDSKVPADVKAKLVQLTQDVIDKEILVPERHEATP